MFASPIPTLERRRPRAHRRAARRARRAEGGRLLGAPLRDHQRAARLRPGRDVLGRPRPAAGAAAAVGRRHRHRRPVPLDAAHGVVAAAADLVGDLARPRRAGRATSIRPPSRASSSTPTRRRARRRSSSATCSPPERRWASPTSLAATIVVRTDHRRVDRHGDPNDLQPLVDVRLLNPSEFQSRFQIDGGEEAGLTIDDVDVDRYELDGGPAAGADRRPRARPRRCPQPQLAGPPPDQHARVRRSSWRRPGRVRASGRPAYQNVDLARPELYFSPSLTGYAVAGTEESERPCGDNEPYSGTVGRGDVVVRPPPGVRIGVHGLQRRRLGGDRLRLADALGPQRPRPGREAGTVPVLRR